MSDSELKLNIINSITSTNDSDMLKEIEGLIRFQSEQKPFLIDTEAKKSIKISREQIEQNEVVSNADVQSEIKEWLKE
ncbi:hypothetical protein [Flavobacterium sp. CS20]|jgi:hypothetical protein|uniref:hypothetical protein n=1 Tax=Flavobacterium sp. CS20 TaxID=2775246 RepID=UPI001B3A3474|nr:hypothetical protein [Flavobacterium sp. CS20]QTY28109.1 hypothetical protein IGB25_06370 [Flavobacterium sp. CS20]